MIITTTLTDIVPEVLLSALSEEAVEVVLRDIAASARNHWEKLAETHLTTSRRDYINSLQEVEYRPSSLPPPKRAGERRPHRRVTAVITLVGEPANLIENGIGAVDLRDWLLGPNVPEAPLGQPGKRRSKGGGFYRAIPFRHQVPGTLGISGGRVMGDPYRGVIAGARQLGKSVYKEAKKLRPGQRLKAGLVPKLRKHHKTDIYAGMRRPSHKYKSTSQGQFETFRTISDQVKTGWIRPATGPRHFAQRTAAYVARLAPKAFAAYVRGAITGSSGGGT